MKLPEQDATFKIVSAADLEAATKAGWRLVEVLQESAPEYYYVQEPLPVVNGVQYSGLMGPATQKVAVVRKHVYLLKMSAESVIKQYEEKTAAAETKMQEAEALRNDALKQVMDAQTIQKANVDTFQKEHARMTEQLRSTSQTLTEYVERASTFKDDINAKDSEIKELTRQLAKVWAALGQMQMERILGTGAASPDQAGAPRKTVGHHLMEEDD